MILITGLLGMMALGSLAFLAFNDESEEPEPDPDPEETEGSADSFDPGHLDPDEADEAGSPPVAIKSPADVSRDPAALPDAPVPPYIDTGAQEVSGSADDDSLSGSDVADLLRGFGGADTLLGDAGADDLYGDEGDDDLFAGTGDDTLLGGLGADLLHGNAGHDALHGREGDDTLTGGRGADSLFGGAGNDLLNGLDRGADGEDRDGRDYLNGGTGDDTVFAGEDDVVSLGAGADILVLGEWMTAQGAQVLDFDEEEDQLMVVYNDQAHGDTPEVELRLSAADPSLTEIVLGDEVLATLSTEDAPDLSSIVLIGESTLADLGLEPLAARQAG